MLDFIPVVLKNIFSKPVTRNYPFIKRKPYENQKGKIQLNIDSCIFCGMCSRKCPADAIKVDRLKRSWEIDRFKCIVCGACAESCPKKSLSISGKYTLAANKKSVEVYIGKPAETKTAPKNENNSEPGEQQGKKIDMSSVVHGVKNA